MRDQFAVLFDDDIAAARADDDIAAARAELETLLESEFPELADPVRCDLQPWAPRPAVVPVSRHASPVTQLVQVCRRALARWARRRPARSHRPAPARHDPRTTALAAGRDSSASAAPMAKPAEPAAAAGGRAYQQRLGQPVRRGINISPAPYGYRIARAEPSGQPRLVPDPPHDRVVAQIFTWRVHHHLDIAEIAARLRRYPPPGRGRWTNQTVAAILTNPRYTGHQVWRYRDGNTGLTPPEQWVVSDRPAHPPLATLTTYLAAQDIPEHTKAALRRRLRHRHSRVAR